MNLFTILIVIVAVGGLVMVVRQMRFGTAAQRLARTLSEEGALERAHLPRNEKGRVLPEAAAVELAAKQAAVDQAPQDWRAWFKLGVAYGDMRNPHAARAAVRRAVALERAESHS